MTYSMTGYARHTLTCAWGEMDIELRGVNHRYLDVNPRLPGSMRALESALRSTISERVERGKVDLTIHLNPLASQRPIVFDTNRLGAVADAIGRIQSKGIDCRAPDALALLDYPGVQRAPDADIEDIRADLMAGLAVALETFQSVRAAEGQRLAEIVRDRLGALSTHVDEVAKRLPAATRSWRDKLDKRLADMNIDADMNRLEQEMVQLAQRTDIAEEVDRLKTHVAAVENTLDGSQAAGRRLDFLMQECNRETNTIGSKSQDAEISAHVLDMKVLVEQMREQIQNIE